MFYADLDILVVGIGVQKPIAFFLGNAVDGLRGRFAATHLPARREDTGRVLLKSLLKGASSPGVSAPAHRQGLPLRKE